MNAAIEPQGAVNPRLWLWVTIRLSYATYFRNFGDVLRISWLWLLVVSAVTGLSSWIEWSWMAQVMAGLKPGTLPQTPALAAPRPIAMLVLEGVAYLVAILAFVSIAVAWHRRIILDEHPAISGSNLATRDLWRYAGLVFAICLISFIPVLVIYFLAFRFFAPFASGGAPPRPSAMLLVIPLSFLIDVTCMFLMLRLIFVLPARAAGDLGLTFTQTWRRTRGNVGRILSGIAACTFPAIVPVQIAVVVLVGFPDPGMLGSETFVVRMAAVTTVVTVYLLLIFPLPIGFLSLSYRHFFQQPQSLQQAAPPSS